MIFHSFLQSIIYGYFRISAAHPPISALRAAVSLRHAFSSQKLQNASPSACSQSFHPYKVSLQSVTSGMKLVDVTLHQIGNTADPKKRL